MAIDLNALYSGWTPPADTRQYWTDEDGNVRLDENGNPRLRASANEGVEYDPQGAYESYLFKNGVVPISSMDTLSRNASALGMDATSFMQMLQGPGQFTTMPDGTQVYVPNNAQMGTSAQPMWAPEYEATGLKGFLQSPVAALAGGLLGLGPLQGFSMADLGNWVGDTFGGSGGSAIGGGAGGSMDLLDYVNELTGMDLAGDASNLYSGNGAFSGGLYNSLGEIPTGMDLAGDASNLFTGNGAFSGGAFDAAGNSTLSLWEQLRNGFNSIPSGLSSLANNLFGGSGTSGINLGGLLGGNSLLSTGLAVAPALAAINYARNQSPFDTSKLESIYGQYSPSGQTYQYDLASGAGRGQLASNLERRGIMGSSFGDQSLANYDISRTLGRNALLNQGALSQANIANSIIAAQAKERELRNNMYGSALYALAGGLAPRNSNILARA